MSKTMRERLQKVVEGLEENKRADGTPISTSEVGAQVSSGVIEQNGRRSRRQAKALTYRRRIWK